MSTLENEQTWDKLLKIRTTGRDDTIADQYRYPYEPTPYTVLERLANSGMFTRRNVLLDFGCGKGRVDFFMSYQTRCRSIGIEYDPRIFACAAANQETAISAARTTFYEANAEQYSIPEEVDRLFFFNPFSIEILKKVMARILDSWYDNPRQMQLFFYYPSDEYIRWLMTVDELEFLDEIDCRDLFPGNDPRERIVIFVLGE